MRIRSLVPVRTALSRAQRIVAHLTPQEVALLAEAAKKSKKGERDSLLILVLFQTGLRISEALSLTPAKITYFEGRPALDIIGKGKKRRMVACPERLTEKLQAYAYKHKLGPDDKFFPINRQRAWQIVKEASKRAGFSKNVYPHILRHSDAIERLKQTGNPKALQHHLGHSSPLMVMRYLSTLTQEDSLRIQQQVNFDGER